MSEQVITEPLLRSETVADWLSVSKSTLCRWRQTGHGPKCVWLSEGCPRYRRTDVEDWIREHGGG